MGPQPAGLGGPHIPLSRLLPSSLLGPKPPPSSDLRQPPSEKASCSPRLQNCKCLATRAANKGRAVAGGEGAGKAEVGALCLRCFLLAGLSQRELAEAGPPCLLMQILRLTQLQVPDIPNMEGGMGPTIVRNPACGLSEAIASAPQGFLPHPTAPDSEWKGFLHQAVLGKAWDSSHCGPNTGQAGETSSPSESRDNRTEPAHLTT